MQNNSIFATSINQMMQKNKFFQCFGCLEQFNSSNHFPMEICQRQHFMCLQCVSSNLFKKNLLNNGYQCNLCSSSIQKKSIRRSPFLLSIKEFIGQLIDRQKIRKQKYNQCLSKQSQLAEQLMNENIEKTSKIQLLEEQLRQQQQLVNRLLQNTNLKQNQNNNNPTKSKNNIIKNTLNDNKSNLSIKRNDKQQKQDNKIINKQKLPLAFRSMFQQIQVMKKQIQKNEDKDNQEYLKKLQQLKKHEGFLYEIIQNTQQQQAFISQYKPQSKSYKNININNQNINHQNINHQNINYQNNNNHQNKNLSQQQQTYPDLF